MSRGRGNQIPAIGYGLIHAAEYRHLSLSCTADSPQELRGGGDVHGEATSMIIILYLYYLGPEWFETYSGFKGFIIDNYVAVVCLGVVELLVESAVLWKVVSRK